MKPLTRRSVIAGSAAAVTAIPALGLCKGVETPLGKVRRVTSELEQAMQECYPDTNVVVLTYDTPVPGEAINPHVLIAATPSGPPQAPLLATTTYRVEKP